jgi:ribosome-associated protein
MTTRPEPVEPGYDPEARRLAVLAAQVADAQKGTDIVILAVGEVLSVADYFVVVSGSNRRLVGALVEEIEAQCRQATGRSPLRVEGAREQQWVLIDYGDVVVHVFLDETRDFYEIERLYTDVPRIAW